MRLKTYQCRWMGRGYDFQNDMRGKPQRTKKMNELKFSDDEKESYDFSETIPEQFIVTDKEFDQDMYEQFMAESEWLEPQSDYADLIRQGEQLSGNTMPISEKKGFLVQLASWGTAEAYRLLQKYCTRSDPALEQWSRIALYECRMRLESDLLDVPVGLILTGLGGNGERLRYIFVLVFQGESSEEGQQREIREGLDKVCQQYHSVVEQAQFRLSCLYVQVLVPMDVAVGEVIEESLARLNQHKEEFLPDYLVTNVSVPTDEEIQEFLDDLQPEG
ncbi:MAG: hypothetical protein D3903_07030 [Candidatus Electrothrix sp. GM3_4]|nr:hypothetical protein [Candidatus Electrothrix sp. GM3_4]